MFGNADAERSQQTLLQSFRNNPGWPVWPSQWTRGAHAQLSAPAPGAWTAPAGLGRVMNNIASMFKRLEVMSRDDAKRGGLLNLEERQALGL